MFKTKKISLIQIVCVIAIIASLYFILIFGYFLIESEKININQVVTIEEKLVTIEEIDNGPKNAYRLTTNQPQYHYYIWNDDLFDYDLFIEKVNVGETLSISVCEYHRVEDVNGSLITEYQRADVCGLHTNQLEFINLNEFISDNNNRVQLLINIIIGLSIITMGSSVILTVTKIKNRRKSKNY